MPHCGPSFLYCMRVKGNFLPPLLRRNLVFFLRFCSVWRHSRDLFPLAKCFFSEYFEFVWKEIRKKIDFHLFLKFHCSKARLKGFVSRVIAFAPSHFSVEIYSRLFPEVIKYKTLKPWFAVRPCAAVRRGFHKIDLPRRFPRSEYNQFLKSLYPRLMAFRTSNKHGLELNIGSYRIPIYTNVSTGNDANVMHFK